MTLIRDRQDAVWVPSRYRYALFRLAALAWLSVTPPRPRPGLILARDRDQTALEHYLTAIWLIATGCIYSFELLDRWLVTAAAVVLSIPLGIALVQVPQYVVGIPLRGRNNQRLQSLVLATAVFLWSSYLATEEGLPRGLALTNLALFATNGAAALLLLILRGPMERAERRFE